MGGKSGGNREAEQARRDEQERQSRIRGGTQRVNTIFDGGTYGTGLLQEGARYDPSQNYFLADGTRWSPGGGENGPIPTGIGGSGGPADFDQLIREGKLYTGTGQSSGFGNDFFAGRRQAFMDYANPQLEQQHDDASRQLAFALTRGGLLDSSTRGQKTGELQQAYTLQRQNVADQALGHETQARNAVEDARANLISMLNATGDAEGAANAALARSTALSRPQPYSPLGQLFADFTATLDTRAAHERAAQLSGGWYRPGGGGGGFTNNPGRVRVS